MPNTNVNIYTPDAPTLAQCRFALRNHYHLLGLSTALSALLTFLQSLHLIYEISNAFMYACFSLGDITENDNFREKFSLVNPGKDQPSCKEETGLYGGEKKVSAVSLVLRVGVLVFFFCQEKRKRGELTAKNACNDVVNHPRSFGSLHNGAELATTIMNTQPTSANHAHIG